MNIHFIKQTAIFVYEKGYCLLFTFHSKKRSKLRKYGVMRAKNIRLSLFVHKNAHTSLLNEATASSRLL